MIIQSHGSSSPGGRRRAMPDCNGKKENALVLRAWRLLATYQDMAELIRVGAYRRGSDPRIDEAIGYYQRLEGFLGQDKNERSDIAGGHAMLGEVPGMAAPDAAERGEKL